MTAVERLALGVTYWCLCALWARYAIPAFVALVLDRPKPDPRPQWRLDRTVSDTHYAVGWGPGMWLHERWQVGT